MITADTNSKMILNDDFKNVTSIFESQLDLGNQQSCDNVLQTLEMKSLNLQSPNCFFLISLYLLVMEKWVT